MFIEPDSMPDHEMRWTRYCNLSGAELEVSDKLYTVFMFYQVNNKEHVSIRKFCELHGIPLSTFLDWKTAYDEFKDTGVLRMQKKRGRPNEVDEVGIQSLKVRLAEKIRAQHAPGKEEFRAMVFDEIVATYERKGIGARATICSNRTVKRIKTYHKFDERDSSSNPDLES
jgi:hypothetical protein